MRECKTNLLHAIEGRARLEPLDLLLVESVLERHLDLRAVGLGQHPATYHQRHYRANAAWREDGASLHGDDAVRCEGGEAEEVDRVASINLRQLHVTPSMRQQL